MHKSFSISYLLKNNMSEQNYYPYRTLLLSKDELVEFNSLSPKKVIQDIAILWGQILALWVSAFYLRQWWFLCVSAALVGNRYYSLYIIGHDGLHRRLHSRMQINDLVNDCFVLAPLGAITRINRSNHMKHHADFSTDTDPDRYKYISRHELSPVGFMFSLTGVPFVLRAIWNVYAARNNRSGENGLSYKVRDVLIVLAWQLVLIFGLGLAFGWWGYFLMWLIPVYIFTYATDIIRVYCEHSVESGDNLSFERRLITYFPGPVELLLFAPMNMNHHVSHHLWPSIPYYNLPRVTRLIYSRLDRLPKGLLPLTCRGSYVRYIFDIFKKCFN